jgi:hypothetical protein
MGANRPCNILHPQPVDFFADFGVFLCTPPHGFSQFLLENLLLEKSATRKSVAFWRFWVYPPTQVRISLAIFCILSRLIFFADFGVFLCIPPHGFESILKCFPSRLHQHCCRILAQNCSKDRIVPELPHN